MNTTQEQAEKAAKALEAVLKECHKWMHGDMRRFGITNEPEWLAWREHFAEVERFLSAPDAVEAPSADETPTISVSPTKWGIERTETTNWIGILRADGKCGELICQTDREGLKPDAVARNDSYAEQIVNSVNEFTRLRAENARLREFNDKALDRLRQFLVVMDLAADKESSLQHFARSVRALLAGGSS